MSPDAFLNALRAHGLEPARPLNLPLGSIVRYRPAVDKPGSRNNAWAVWHGPWGAYGSWKTGQTHTWFERNPAELSPAERAERARQHREARQRHAAEEARAHALAREKAAALWKRGRHATNAHPYCQTKGVPAYGLRALRDALMVPARDTSGELHTLQFIQPDGTKRFLTGGRIKGCYFPIGQPAEALLICEGVATAATLHQATGQAVAAAFHCGNLQAVAQALRSKFPELRLVIVADNDATPGNPGLTHARAAAAAVGAWLAVPDFEGCPT